MGHLLLSKYTDRCVLFICCVCMLWGTDSCYLVIFLILFLLHVSIQRDIVSKCVHGAIAHMQKSKGQLSGVDSPLPPCGFQVLQAWKQAPLPTEPSHNPLVSIFFFNSVNLFLEYQTFSLPDPWRSRHIIHQVSCRTEGKCL